MKTGIELVGTGEEHDFEDVEKDGRGHEHVFCVFSCRGGHIRSCDVGVFRSAHHAAARSERRKVGCLRYFNCYGDGAAGVGPPGRGLVPRRARAGVARRRAEILSNSRRAEFLERKSRRLPSRRPNNVFGV